jgi:RNA polymerase sigma factor (sigma-70 family)
MVNNSLVYLSNLKQIFRLLLKTLTYTEQELLEGLRLHDQQAYSYLYDNYSRALFTVIYNIVSRQELAEEVLQEAFVKIWQNIGSYDTTKGRLYTWMINIARNQAIDRTRSREFSNQSKTTELSDNVYEGKPAQDNGPKDVGLLQTINKLPEENRKLLELAYFQGYTHDEISQMLNIPLGTIKTRIRTTILQLRKILGVNKL